MAPAGPGPAQWQRPCRPGDVTATATTRAIGGAVQGVIRLLGRHCSLHISNGPTALVGENGARLDVALKQRSNELIGDPRPDLSLAAGDVLWGFSWTGSWCGPRAAGVVVPLVDDTAAASTSYGTVVAPISGEQLRCTSGSTALLTQGYGGPDAIGDDFSDGPEAVLPRPAAWSELTAALILPDKVTATSIPSPTLVISNPTDEAVVLLPCPAYGLEVAAGSDTLTSIADPLPCSGTMVVPAHDSLRIHLATITYGTGQPRPDRPGTQVTVSVAIAGIHTAVAATRVG